MLIKRQAGVTLIELIIAMVIIGVAVAGLVAVFRTAVISSVDPVIHKQMTAIAEGLMEEILIKPFAHGPGLQILRADFDDVLDYHSYGPTSPQDIHGNQIAGLENYSVEVSAQVVTLMADVPTAHAIEIRITVVNGGETFVLTGWRTNF